MQHLEDDQNLITYFQRANGYSLSGSTKKPCLFILIGDGANGKFNFVNMIDKLLGDYSKLFHLKLLNIGIVKAKNFPFID